MIRKVLTIVVLCAWLLSTGIQWDLLQGFAWGRMIANYSQSMPVSEAVRLTFSADNLCGVCELVAEHKTREDHKNASGETTPATGDAAKGKLLLVSAPVHGFIFSTVPPTAWPSEDFLPAACTRPAPPTEPPRTA